VLSYKHVVSLKLYRRETRAFLLRFETSTVPDLYSKKKGGGERGSSGIPGTLSRVRP